MVTLESATHNTWVPYTQTLPFMLGDFCLRTVRLPAVMLDRSFLMLTVDDDVLPQRPLPKGVRVAVVSGQPVQKDAPQLTYLPEWIRYVTVNEDRYYVDLRGSFDAYLDKFSSKSRKNLRRTRRLFAEHSGGEITWRESRTPLEMSEFLKQAARVSRASYQQPLGQGLPETEEFVRWVADKASQDGVRGYLLLHQHDPVAYIFCYAQGEALVYDHIGYDPQFKTWSPGTLLLLLVLERLFTEQRFQFLDFGGMAHTYKDFFSTGHVRCARMLYFERTWRNARFVRAHASTVGLSLTVGRLLSLIGLKRRIKALTRYFNEPPRVHHTS